MTDVIVTRVAKYLHARRKEDERKGRTKPGRKWRRPDSMYIGDTRVAKHMILMWSREAGYDLSAEVLDEMVDKAKKLSREMT